jgi:hypothetical protein
MQVFQGGGNVGVGREVLGGGAEAVQVDGPPVVAELGGRARHADRRQAHPVHLDRDGDTAEPDAALVVVQGVSAFECRLQVAGQGVQGGQGVLGAGRERLGRQVRCQVGGVEAGQQHLAEPGAVRGVPGAGHDVEADRPVGFADADVQHFRPVQHTKVGGLPGVGGDPGEVAARDLRQVQPGQVRGRQRQCLVAEPIGGTLVDADDVPHLLQDGEEPHERALGQSRVRGEVVQRQRAAPPGQPFQQGQAAGQRVGVVVGRDRAVVVHAGAAGRGSCHGVSSPIRECAGSRRDARRRARRPRPRDDRRRGPRVSRPDTAGVL